MSTAPEQKDTSRLAGQWEITKMTLAAHAAQKHVALGGTFELTPRCNLRCKMCYARLDMSQIGGIGRELTAREWISLAEAAAEAGTLNLLLTGGEPLIRSDFEEIYTALSGMGFIITLNTNATLITEKILKLLEKYPPTATNVTLYGASPETYARVCGNAEGFNRTLRGLEMLSGVSTELEIRSTFIQDNMHELDELREIANRYTKRFAINTDVFKAIRGACSDVESCRLTPDQMFEIIDDNAEYYRKLNSQTEMALERNIETDHNAKDKEYGYELPPRVLYCLAAKSMYWITWDGKMLPCGTFTSPYTLPLDEGFKSAWDRLPSTLENLSIPAECAVCGYAHGMCPNCPAILQAETGSFGKISPYICEIAKKRAQRASSSTIGNGK